MSQRATTCPKCNSKRCEVLKILNPKTIDMNADAEFKCLECDNLWFGKTISPHYAILRSKRRIR